jgi:hypothetical protein
LKKSFGFLLELLLPCGRDSPQRRFSDENLLDIHPSLHSGFTSSKKSFGFLLELILPCGKESLTQTLIIPTQPYYKAPFMEQRVSAASVCKRCEIPLLR